MLEDVLQQTEYIGRCIQEGFESFEAGRGAVKQLGGFIKEIPLLVPNPKMCLLLCLYVG